MLALGLMIHVTAAALWAGCLLALFVVLLALFVVLLALFVVLLPLLSGRGRRNAGR